MIMQLSWIEGRRAEAGFVLCTDTDLRRVLSYENMIPDDHFTLRSDDNFLRYETKDILNMEPWLGFQVAIQELGKEKVLNDHALLNPYVVKPYVSCILKGFPSLSVNSAYASYYYDEKEKGYRCSVFADFKI